MEILFYFGAVCVQDVVEGSGGGEQQTLPMIYAVNEQLISN